MHPAVFADEPNAVRDTIARFIHKRDRRGLRVFKTHAPAEHVVAGAALRPLGGLVAHADGSGVIRAIAPLRDVEVMNAPAGKHAEGEVGDVLVKVALRLLDVVIGEGRRADPALPIDEFRHRLLRKLLRRDATGHGDLDFLHFAQTTVACELAGPAEFEITALLRAELEHNARLARRGAHMLRLRHGHAHRLFVVDVLFVQHRIRGRNAVPVHRQRHQNGIDRRIAIQLAEVAEHLHLVTAVGFLDVALCSVDAALIYITESRHAHVRIRQKRPHVMRALRAAADDAQRGLVRRRGLAPQHARRHKVRRDARGEHGMKEGAAVVHGGNHQR